MNLILKKIVYHLNKRKKKINKLVEENIKKQVQKVFVVKCDRFIYEFKRW